MAKYFEIPHIYSGSGMLCVEVISILAIHRTIVVHAHLEKARFVRQKGNNVSSLPFVVQMVYMDTNYIGEYKRGKIYPNQLPR